MSEPPVFYVARFVPHYRVPVLERLNARLDGRLVVCAGQPPHASSLRSIGGEEADGYRTCHLRNYWLRGEALHAQPYGRAFRTYGPPSVILAEESPRTLTLPLLMRRAHRVGAGFVLWGHFSSNDRPFDPKRHLADRYRMGVARRADACVGYTESVTDLLRPYVPNERLFTARNTLDTDVLFALYDRLECEGRTAVRSRLRLPASEPVLAFIGRLIPDKGLDLLLDVFQALRRRRPARLVLLGDGPERVSLEARIARERIEGVHLLGAMPGWAESAPYLYAADVMVMPGYLGLAVNHAFAFGLPVVSQGAPPGIRFHSPEVDYVRHGENGMLAAHGDVEALLEAVEHVLAHHEQFSRKAGAYAREHLTIDKMVDGLEAAVRYAAAHRR